MAPDRHGAVSFAIKLGLALQASRDPVVHSGETLHAPQRLKAQFHQRPFRLPRLGRRGRHAHVPPGAIDDMLRRGIAPSADAPVGPVPQWEWGCGSDDDVSIPFSRRCSCCLCCFAVDRRRRHGEQMAFEIITQVKPEARL